MATENINSYKRLKKLLVFLVDDDVMFLKSLERSMANKLHLLEIKKFQTGEACLHQMKLKPDIIFLDYYLDSEFSYAWNGLEILEKIKVLNPLTKVIFLSSQVNLEIASQCLKNGALDYVSKSKSAFGKINGLLDDIIQNINVTITE